MKNKILLSIGVISLLSIVAQAQSFEPVGYKASSMGGAGVASSRNAMASYYNPALLAKADRDLEIAFGIGVGFVDQGALQSANDLNDADFSDLIDKGINDFTSLTPADIDSLSNSRDLVLAMNNQGALVTPSAYLSAQIGSFSVGVMGSMEVGVYGKVSQAHDQLIFDDGSNTYFNVETQTASTQTEYEASSLEFAVDNGLTFLVIDSLAIVEVPLSYGHAFNTGFGDISLGGTFKLMQGTSTSGTVKVDSDDIIDDVKDSEEKSSTFGIDVGLLYEPSFTEGLRLGFVGKNLNSPEFDRSSKSALYTLIGSTIKVDPMFRIGIAYDIFESLEFAMDYDISKNETLALGGTPSGPGETYETQYLGGGVNWGPATWFSLRGGLMQNQANDYAGLLYTAGFAIGPEAFQLDISGQMSSKTLEVDGDTYPRAARVNIAFISRW